MSFYRVNDRRPVDRFPTVYFLFIYFSEEDEAEDEVDSDFSIDENDEPVSDHNEEGVKTVKRRLVTKAYKVTIY